MPTIIRVSNLSKYYREVKAVDDLSFSVNSGEIYGFLGQNGAGKSTTIRMLLTLIESTGGTIEMFGMDLRKNRKKILQQVGAIIERPDVYKYLTAFENLRLFAKMSGVVVQEKKLISQLEKVGLSDRAHNKVKTYSQGMKQRLGLAVALVHDPQLIILDEPMNGLDPQGIADVRNLILHLSRHEGKTILVSSHLLNEMEMIADKLLIIDKGKKMVEGAVAELFDSTRILVAVQVANTEHTINSMKNSSWESNITSQSADSIIFQLDKKQIPALAKELVNNGAEIISIQPRHSLEQYFLSFTSSSQHVDPFKN